jgi:hypothetical protein
MEEKKGCSMCKGVKRKAPWYAFFIIYSFTLLVWGQIELIRFIWSYISKLW